MSDRYLIVSVSQNDYLEEIRHRKLDPFQCARSTNTYEAFCERWRNMQAGIETDILWTVAFDATSPIGRRTS